MIVTGIKDCPEKDTEFVKTYIIKINPIDDYKFRRWLDIMNNYDNMKKSTHNYKSLLDEIKTDYDKDFKERDDVFRK